MTRSAEPLALALFAALAVALSGCGSSNEFVNAGPEERFAAGKALYDGGDYVEAMAEFDVVKLQFPGSAVADDAQYFTGMSHFKRGEFLLAVEDFRTLKRSMASSPLVPDAQYHIAESYYELSPRPAIDQTYTRAAIDEFQAFIEYYPLNDRREEAESKIRELNGKLAEKLFDSAGQYVKLGYHRSAGVYFDLVLQQFHDTPFAEPAHIGKIASLVDRRRYAEAKEELGKFRERYPDSPLAGEADALEARIPADLSGISR